MEGTEEREKGFWGVGKKLVDQRFGPGGEAETT